MKKLSIILSILVSLSVWAGEEKKSLTVNFDHDKYELSEKDKVKLTKLVDEVDILNDYTIRLSGHTDNSGSHSYNDDLSLKRAEAVKAYLIHEGIGPESISFDYHGERKPVEKNENDEKMRKNRRVEVTYSTYYFESSDELLDSLSSLYTSEYTIDPTIHNEISTPHGLTLNIDPLSFVTEEGMVLDENINITIKEGNDFNSFVAHDLMTISGDQMIESDGMFRISATTEGGKSVELDENRPITASLATEQMKSNMELFVSNDGQDWTSTGPIVQQSEVVSLVKPKLTLINVPDFKYKKYNVDKKSMPIPPVRPIEPREPHEPRKESYEPSHNLWTWLFPKRAEEAANERYMAAMEKYDEKTGKYEERKASYDARKEQFRKNEIAYRKDYQLWLKEQRQLADADYEDQLKEYEAVYGEQAAENERRKAMMGEQRERYRQQLLAAQAKQMDQRKTSMNEAESYVFNVTRLGWINCDRFIETEERVLAVWDNDITDEMVRLIFPDQKGMMGLSRLDGEEAYRLNTMIPPDEKMIVFGLKVRFGRPYIFYHPVKDNEENIEMDFKVTRFSDLKGILDDIRNSNTAMLY